MSSLVLPDINQNNRYVQSSKDSAGDKRAPQRSHVAFQSDTKRRQFGSSYVEQSQLTAAATASNSKATPSLLSNSQSLVAIRSIDKYYKTNDVHDILGHEKDYYPQFPSSIKANQETEVDGNLKSLKKSFNLLRSKSDQREREIQNMRNEIDNMKNQEAAMGSRIGGADQQFDVLSEQYDTTRQNQLEEEMRMKTYEHMINRMKKDIIAYRLKAYETEDTLVLGESVFVNASTKKQQIVQKEGKAQQALNQVLKAKEEENMERQEYLENYKNSLMEQNELERQREERIKRQQEIAEIAANDIRDLNLKKWRKLLLVHTFLNTFLKRKMENEMKKYAAVEQSFQKIKAATGIHDAGEIVHKFLKREQTYSSLLLSISEYEKKIELLKKTNGGLSTKLEELKQEMQPLDKLDLNKQDKLIIDEIYQKYTETAAKSENCHLVQDRVYHWMLRTLEKLDRCVNGELKDRDMYQSEYPYEKQQDLLKKITEIVTENLKQVEANNEAETLLKVSRTQKLTQDAETMRRVNRVRPVAAELLHSASFDKQSFSGDISHNSENYSQNDSISNLSDLERTEVDNVDQLRKETKEIRTRSHQHKATFKATAQQQQQQQQ